MKNITKNKLHYTLYINELNIKKQTITLKIVENKKTITKNTYYLII